jgi:hypothetical protein
MFSAPQPVASGCPYAVTEVSGHQPDQLDEFVGDTAFMLIRDRQICYVGGTGVRTGGDVRFLEKDAATGKDIRVWCITAAGAHRFAAHTVAP